MAAKNVNELSKVISVGVESLYFDVENPRFPGLQDQRAALHYFCGDLHAKKTVVLAESIVEVGLNPSELLIVTRAETGKKFVVLEGNRRLAALKLLSNPARIKESPLSSPFKARLRKAAATYAELEPAKPRCLLISTRENANYWIGLKHTGENEGIGVVQWDGEERQRFRGYSPTLKLLDYVRDHATLSEEAQLGLSRFPITNLERLLGDPAVRKALGIELVGGDLFVTHAPDEVLKGLTKVIEDIARAQITVTDIKLKKHRADYIDRIRSHLPSSKPLGESINLEDANTQQVANSSAKAVQKKESQTHRVPPRRERKSVIPKKTIIEIGLPKINEVYSELQRINANDFTNGASALLRIFIDTTTLEYVTRFNIQVPTNSIGQKELKPRIEKSISEFVLRTGEREIGKAAKNALLQPNGPIFIEQLHLQLHGRYEHPSPDNLRLGWDAIDGWMKGMWVELSKP
jgi:hypothetical protein